MNELLQKHGCSNVFTIPEGLKELMSDISREVLREQPTDICKFIANYLSALLLTREHGMMAVKILDDLCDCRPSVSEHLMQLGIQQAEATILSQVIKEEIEGFQPDDKKETIKEYQIMKKILNRTPLDEVMAAKVCQVARNAYRDYWYRKKTLEKSLKMKPEETWEIAAKRTLELYKRTKPSLSELTRAAEKIQAAYRGYYVRRNLLQHLKPKSKKKGPKVDLLGPPLDVAESREIDLGPLINIDVHEEDIHGMFEEHRTETLGLPYDPMKTITHVPDDEEYQENYPAPRDRMSIISGISSQMPMSKISQIEHKQSRAPSNFPSDISEGKRESRLPSKTESRKSRIDSQIEGDESTIRESTISFSEVPPKIIPGEDLINDEEVKEVLAPGTPDDSEVGAIEGVSENVHEDYEDIPEDITDHTEGEESLPASVPSSAPETANTTDVEDEGGYVDDVEEEEN